MHRVTRFQGHSRAVLWFFPAMVEVLFCPLGWVGSAGEAVPRYSPGGYYLGEGRSSVLERAPPRTTRGGRHLAEPFLTGVRPPTPREQARSERLTVPYTSAVSKALPRDPPARVVNITYLPAVWAQQLNNCATFAPTYYLKTWQEAKEHGWVRPDPWVDPEHVMSPGFTFPLNNGGDNDATTIVGALTALCQYGCAPWSVMPENPNDWYTYPRPEQFLAARPYRADHILSFEGIGTEQDLNDLKAYLAGGELVCFGLNVYHDVHQPYPSTTVGVSNEVIYAIGEDLWSEHAFTLIGYDDSKEYEVNGEAKRGAFLAVNSWGPGWGVSVEEAGSGGFVWFGYEYLAQENRGFLGLVDRIGYQPGDVAFVEIFHEKMAELELLIHAGPKLSPPIAPQEVTPPTPQLYSYRGTLMADLSDFQSLEPMTYWLTIRVAAEGQSYSLT